MKPRSFGENLSIMQTVHDGIYRDMLYLYFLGFLFIYEWPMKDMYMYEKEST